ncbi:MAG: hypothetical protein Q9226_007082 [Calogaya cf. arnoldii]
MARRKKATQDRRMETIRNRYAEKRQPDEVERDNQSIFGEAEKRTAGTPRTWGEMTMEERVSRLEEFDLDGYRIPAPVPNKRGREGFERAQYRMEEPNKRRIDRVNEEGHSGTQGKVLRGAEEVEWQWEKVPVTKKRSIGYVVGEGDGENQTKVDRSAGEVEWEGYRVRGGTQTAGDRGTEEVPREEYNTSEAKKRKIDDLDNFEEEARLLMQWKEAQTPP